MTICLAFGLSAAGFELLQDGLNGFEFSRSGLSWSSWLVGLLVGGILSLAFEGLGDWLFEPDHWYSTGPRRSTRLKWATLVVAAVALVILLFRSCKPT